MSPSGQAPPAPPSRRLAWLRAPDLRLLAIFAGVAALVSGALLIGYGAGGGATAFDRAILLALRNAPDDPVGSASVEGAIVHLSALGSGAVATLVTLLAVTYLALAGRRRFALLVAACAVGTELWMSLLKYLYGRARPTLVTQLDPPGGLSFPSGHSMISVALYLTLAVLIARTLEHRRLRVFVVAAAGVLAFVIGASRVYLGVHYPTDVIAGWTLGLAWALICGLFARWLGGRGKVEAAGPATDTAA